MPGPDQPARREVSASARRPALLLALCVITGIALHSVIPHYPQIWLITAALLAIIAAVLFHLPRSSGLMLMLALISAGAAVGQIEAFYYPADHISAYATDDPRLAWLELQIDHEPRVLSDPFNAHPMPPKQVVTASVKRVKTWSGWIDCSGDMLVQIAQ